MVFNLFQFFFLCGIVILPVYQGALPVWIFSISVSLIALAFCIHWISLWKFGSGVLVRTPLDIWVGLYLLLFLIAALNTQIIYSSAVEGFKLAAVVLVFLSTCYYCRGREEIQRLAIVLIVLGSLLSAVGLVQYFGALPKDWWQRPDFLSVGYLNHNHFAGFLELVLPVSLGLAVVEKNRAKKTLFIFLCALMGGAFVLTVSRGGFVSLGLALLFMFFLFWKRGLARNAWRIFATLAVSILCAAFLFGAESVAERIETLEKIKTGEEMSLKTRVSMWKGAAALISKNPWWGTGPGTFEHAFLKFRPAGFTQRPGFAHSDFLQVLSDGGVFVFLATICLFGALFWAGFRVIRRQNSEFRIGVGAGCLAALLAIGFHSFVDFNLHIPANWALTGVVAGLLCSLEERRYYSFAVGQRILKFFISSLIVLVIGGSLFFGVSNYFLLEGKTSLKKERFEEAHRHLTRSIEINPLNPEAYYLRGLAIFRGARNEMRPSSRDQMIKESVKDFDRAISLNVYEPYYDIHRARARRRLLRPEDVKDLAPYYLEAVSKDPRDPKLYYLAGADLLIANRIRDKYVEKMAKEMLRKCVELDVSFTESADRILGDYKKGTPPGRAH